MPMKPADVARVLEAIYTTSYSTILDNLKMDDRFDCLIVVDPDADFVDVTTEVINAKSDRRFNEMLLDGVVRLIYKHGKVGPMVYPHDHFQPDDCMHVLAAPPAYIVQHQRGGEAPEGD